MTKSLKYMKIEKCTRKDLEYGEKTESTADYMIPVFIGIGYANSEEVQLEQYKPDIEKQIRFGRWK